MRAAFHAIREALATPLTVSIHPCRHAQAMKRIFSQMPLASVEQYMPAFLKMLGSMIPTMEYDYTVSI